MNKSKKFGSIALIGLANSGKSTLVNRLVGVKVSIVSPKAHTTRDNVMGVAIYGDTQIELFDSPGFFSKTTRRGSSRSMVRGPWEAIDNSDLALCIFDSRFKLKNEFDYIWNKFKNITIPKFLVLNKVDLVSKSRLLPLTQELNKQADFNETFMISAKNGDGIDEMLSKIDSYLPEGEWKYTEDKTTNLSSRALAAEITREQIYIQLHKEIPYSSRVETDIWEEMSPDSIKVHQTIYVNKDAHRKIVIGDNAAKIKSIGMTARKELENVFDCKFHLYLHVAVKAEKSED